MFDLRLNPETRDLGGGYASGREEVLQRLITRLNRELGEWFLDTSAGLPWYAGGDGLLGSHDRRRLELLVRRETLATDGVARIIKFNPVYDSSARHISIYMQIVLDDGFIAALRMDSAREGTQWYSV